MLAISRLSVFDDIDVKKFCAAAILNLTCEQSLCLRMIEEGVLLAILELAKAQHEEIRRNTSMALCRFSYERTGQLRLVQEGCVSAIISMLNSPDYETKEACVKALINIASYSGTAVAESVVQTILKVSSKKEQASISFSAEAMYNLSLLSGPRAKVVEDGILDNICELSQTSLDNDVKVNLATALCNFSGLTSNLELLSQVRILECIEDLLKNENETVREMCAVTIANISSYPSSLKNLVLSDAVVQLVEMGQKANQVIQENTALSLSNMSATADSRPLLARFGVVSLLLSFLEDASSLTKQYAIVALCSLMVNPSTCSELLQSNIPAVLARLSMSSTDKVKELCANALFNLSCEKSLHSFLLKDDVIKAIVRLCKKFILSPDGVEVEDESVPAVNDKTPLTLLRNQECAIGCLFNLSFFEESRKILIRVDVVKTLFQLFQRPAKNEELLKHCAGTIANLTFDVDSRARMVEDGGVRLLRKLMNSNNKDTLLCCSTACCNLASEALEKTPILSMLIDLSASPHSNITLTCAIAFSKLASNASSRPVLTKCPELYPALTLMMRCGIEDIQIYSAVTLCNLAMERSQRSRHIWKEGTVPDFIVNSLLRINSDSTKEICARALYNLLTHDEYRMAHIKEGVLYALVKLARLESVEIRSLCVTALYNLSCDPSMIDILMEINVAQVITKMCEIEFSNQDIHRRLAACLTNIAMKPGTEIKLVEGGALVAMLVLSEHNDPPTMRYCASVLCYLSQQRSNCEAMAANNLVDVLTKIITSDDNQQNVFGLNALCNISCVPMLHDRMEESNTIPQIIRLLSLNDQEEILLACMQTLYNLTHQAKFRKIMLQNDLVQTLQLVFSRVSMAPTGVIDVCVQILAILCEDPLDWVGLVTNGVVKVLRMVAPQCTSAISILNCVYALSQLARGSDKTGLLMLTDGALDVIAAAIPELASTVSADQQSVSRPKLTAQLTERCSIILRTLSTYTDCLSPLMDDERFILIVEAITRDKHKESCKNTILTLYNVTASKHPDGLDKLVAGGIIKTLIHLASTGGPDMSPACAIALAHIKHIQKDRERPTTANGSESKDSMDNGIVTTLLSMIDMDQTSIQKVDRMAATLPMNLPPLRPNEWVFLSGNTAIRVGAQLPVSWSFQNSAIEDARFIPAEPKTFLALLGPVVPSTGVTVQDKLYGSFQIMKVRQEKFRMKRLDPRFLLASTGSVNGPSSSEGRRNSSGNLSDAIGLAINDEELSFSSPVGSDLYGDGGSSSSGGNLYPDDASDGEEVRPAATVSSPSKKKSSTSRNITRTGSNRSIGESHRGSKASISSVGSSNGYSSGGGANNSAKGSSTRDTAKLTKKESTAQRKHTAASEHHLVLPRL